MTTLLPPACIADVGIDAGEVALLPGGQNIPTAATDLGIRHGTPSPTIAYVDQWIAAGLKWFAHETSSLLLLPTASPSAGVAVVPILASQNSL